LAEKSAKLRSGGQFIDAANFSFVLRILETGRCGVSHSHLGVPEMREGPSLGG